VTGIRESTPDPRPDSARRGTHDDPKRRFPSLAVFCGFAALYSVFRTRDFYWDGIAFAQSIEDSGDHSFLVHPNHLLYTVLGAYLHDLAGSRLGFRAIDTLQLANCLIAALTVTMIGKWLLRVTDSTYLAVCFTVLFGCSATWWRFASDSNAYVPAVAMTVFALGLAWSKPPHHPVFVGMAHAGAMVLHQLAVFAFLPLGVQLFRNSSTPWKSTGQYVLAASVSVLAAYAWAYRATLGKWHDLGFFAWITRSSPEAAFSFDWGRNLALSVRGNVRLLFGGRAPESPGIAEAVLLVALALVLWLFLVRVFRSRSGLGAACTQLSEALWRSRDSLWVWWIAPYVLFLLVWLPQNTFYRLFYLPPLVLLGATVARKARPAGTGFHRLALFTLLVGLWNLQFVVLPASRGDHNRERGVIQAGQEQWAPGTRIYYTELVPENWGVRYFNPQTTWVPVTAESWPQVVGDIADRAGRDEPLWLDSTARTLAMEMAAEEETSSAAVLQRIGDPDGSNSIRGPDGELRFVRLP
jgi:hypothetical protein